MRRVGGQIRSGGSVSSAHGVGVRKVLVHPHVLPWSGDDGGELDIARSGNCRRTWRHWVDFPVIVDIAKSRLVRGEGCAVRVWSCCSVDEVGGVAVEGGGWRVEGMGEVVGLAGLGAIESWSAEGSWEVGDASAIIESLEEVVSYYGDVARIETSDW